MSEGTVIAKFQCVSQRKYKAWAGMKQEFIYEYEFQAVTGGSPENDQFFASTPSGNIKISAVADNLFEPGQSCYVTFAIATIPVTAPA